MLREGLCWCTIINNIIINFKVQIKYNIYTKLTYYNLDTNIKLIVLIELAYDNHHDKNHQNLAFLSETIEISFEFLFSTGFILFISFHCLEIQYCRNNSCTLDMNADLPLEINLPKYEGFIHLSRIVSKQLSTLISCK